MNVFIREYIPDKEDEPCIDCEKGTFFKEAIYDPEKKIVFSLMTEPHWLHMLTYKEYEFEFLTPDDDDTYIYKMWERINPETVIVAQRTIRNDWYRIDDEYVDPSIKRMTVEDYITELKERMKT